MLEFSNTELTKNPIAKKYTHKIYKISHKNFDVHLSDLEVYIDSLINAEIYKNFETNEITNNLLLESIEQKEFRRRAKKGMVRENNF